MINSLSNGQITHVGVGLVFGLIVAVMIDEPSGGSYYGGDVAGPVFSDVMGAALRLLGVPTDAPVDNVILPPLGSEIREET